MKIFETPGHPETHLLIPEMPTPNGRLHLGHISGPFLKMDVLARALRRAGHVAGVVSGSDTYESYVLLNALQNNRSPEEIAERYHKNITSDLEVLDIRADLYLNPLDARYHARFHEFHREWFARLGTSAEIVTRKETVAVHIPTGEYGVGCWIGGTCPVCGNGSGSYLCEECGTHYRPMDLGTPRYNFPAGEVRMEEISTLWLKIRRPEQIAAYLQTQRLPPGFESIAATYLEHQGPWARLTNPGTWGVRIKHPGMQHPQVTFTYTSLLIFSAWCGQVWAETQGMSKVPFTPGSGIITTVGFGTDNAVPFFINQTALALETGLFKPYDHLLANHFAYLQGAKFSTSRRHAIWASEVTVKTPVCSDAVRYFLTKVNPEYARSNFLVDELIDTVNTELNQAFQSRMLGHLSHLKSELPEAMPGVLTEKLAELLAVQNTCLRPESAALADSLQPIRDWLAVHPGEGFSASYWWLKGLALLSAPVMPFTGRTLWSYLGGNGDPLSSQFHTLTIPYLPPAFTGWFRFVTHQDIQPALPETIVKI